MDDFRLGLDLLFSQTGQSLAALFWYTMLFELPRYGMPLAAAALAVGARGRSVEPGPSPSGKVSVLVVGHNEADALERCVVSLRDQTIAGLEIIIVSDGSSDGMGALAQTLVKRGLADAALATDLRSGKSAALNLAIARSTGEFLVTIDCDCSYARDAIAAVIRPFHDPMVGAVCGDVIARNGSASLTARMQEIEYLLTISVAKRIADETGQVSCLSGAFTAFRRSALDDVGSLDVGGGEDLDITLRLRTHGWRVAFAADAFCWTDVPVKPFVLIRQRLRWERDSVRLRYRKHRDTMLPWRERFSLKEAIHQWDFALFAVLGAVIFPVYLVWLALAYGTMTLPILIAMQAALIVVDMVTLAMAALVADRAAFWRNILYMPAYSVFTTWFLRPVRLVAYLHEWLLFGSDRDNYVPERVRLVRKW